MNDMETLKSQMI